MLCVLILYMSGGSYNLKTILNDRFFEKNFHYNFIYSQSPWKKSAKKKTAKEIFFYFVWLQMFCQKSAENKLPKKIIFIFRFVVDVCFDIWPEVWTKALYWISQHIHICIYNWPLQPICQDYGPSFSHHLCCVC